jgi:hypothetical protein
VHLGAGSIGQRVYAIIDKWANDNGPHICSDFIQLLPFNGVQVESWTQSENIFRIN